MWDGANILEDLADRAARGDRAALADLQLELEGRLVPLIREALGGVGEPAFRRRVQATARQLARYTAHLPPDPERLVHRVAGCLCEALVDDLTRAPAGGRYLEETLVA
jgi:hypothetical protein